MKYKIVKQTLSNKTWYEIKELKQFLSIKWYSLLYIEHNNESVPCIYDTYEEANEIFEQL